jgi:hypothetical protein
MDKKTECLIIGFYWTLLERARAGNQISGGTLQFEKETILFAKKGKKTDQI